MNGCIDDDMRLAQPWQGRAKLEGGLPSHGHHGLAGSAPLPLGGSEGAQPCGAVGTSAVGKAVFR